MANKITLGEVERGDVSLKRIFQLNAVLDQQHATEAKYAAKDK